MNTTNAQVDAGQAVYTKQTLAVYDLIVLGISNRFIWRCPTQQLVIAVADWSRYIKVTGDQGIIHECDGYSLGGKS